MARPRISPAERFERESDIREALASVRLEGQEPPPEAHAVYARYIAGEIGIDEMIEEGLAAVRERGPVPVSGD